MPVTNARDALRLIANTLETPVTVALLFMMAATAFLLGTLAVEAFTHGRALKRRRGAITAQSGTETAAMLLVRKEKSRCEGIVKLSDGIARLGPMFGLLGTLIPLGPGIIALGRGDTLTLSQSMLTAFDTTIAGLISAAAAWIISAIRKRWYNAHMLTLEAELEVQFEQKG